MLKERIIWLLLVTALLVLGVKKILPEPENKEVESKLFWIQKTFASAEYDMVLIGDSRTYRGIDPETIGKKAKGIKVLNFGYSSAGLTPWFIQNGVDKLNPNGKKIILLGITPYSLTPKACLNEHYKQERKRKREEVLEAKYFGEVKKYFAPVNPHYLIKHIKDGKTNEDSSFYHQEYSENGWVASWKLKHEYQKTVESYKKEFENNLPSQERINDFLKKVKELKQKGYQICAMRLPIHQALFELEQALCKEQMEELQNKLIELGVKWIEINPITTNSYDGSHLSKEEAIRCSNQIGVYLNN